jgi:hypothetical protein
MNKHTPGPWVLTIYERYSKAIIRTSDGDEVTVVDLQCMPDANADAHLIAAAPDLLAALRTAEAALADIGDADREPGDDVEWCERRAAEALPLVRAAIAKARGEQ